MLDGLLYLISRRPPNEIARDVLDILIVAYLFYRVLLVIKGTRAMQIAVGIVIALSLYLAGRAAGLVTVNTVFQGVLANIVLIVVVVFQNDIRRGLMRVGQGGAWIGGRRTQQTRVVDEVVAAATELARHRTGAIIAFEQEANLLEFTKSEGIPLDAAVTKELLVALFVPEPENKLHDGAVILRDYRLARGGVFFPMPEAKNVDAKFGSRHRASMGITEETDAVVVVVSEERGTITVFSGGNMVPNVDDEQLRTVLLKLLGPNNQSKKKAAAAARNKDGKSQRPEKQEKHDKADKPDRADRGDRGDRADRADRAAEKERAERPDSSGARASSAAPPRSDKTERPEAPKARVQTPVSGTPKVDLSRARLKESGSFDRRPVPPPPDSIDDDETEPPPSRVLSVELGPRAEPAEPKVEVGARLDLRDEAKTEPPPSSSAKGEPKARPSLELPPLRQSSVPMPEANLSAPPEEAAEEP